MASLKTKGDLAELKVATDLVERGYRIAIPYGEDHDYDLILCRDDKLERVQVKYTKSNGDFVVIRTRSHSLTNGKVKRTKYYTAAMVDWIAVYDKTTDPLLLPTRFRARDWPGRSPPSANGTAQLPKDRDPVCDRLSGSSH